VNELVVSNLGPESMEALMCVIALLRSTRSLRSVDITLARASMTAGTMTFQLLRDLHAATLEELCLRQVDEYLLRGDMLQGLTALRTLRLENVAHFVSVVDLLKALQGLRVERVVISAEMEGPGHREAPAPASPTAPSVLRLDVLKAVVLQGVRPMRLLLNGLPNLTTLNLSGGIVITWPPDLEFLRQLTSGRIGTQPALHVSRLTLKQFNYYTDDAVFHVSTDLVVTQDVELWLSNAEASFTVNSAAYLASCNTLVHLPTATSLRLAVAVPSKRNAAYRNGLAAMLARLIRTALPPLVRRVNIVNVATWLTGPIKRCSLVKVFSQQNKDALFKAAAERGVQLQLSGDE
jgi:hypothetical protein